MATLQDEIRKNVVVIALAPSNALISRGYGGLYFDKLVPLSLPDNIKLIEDQDPRFLEGYRYEICLKELPADVLEVVMETSISAYHKNLREK